MFHVMLSRFVLPKGSAGGHDQVAQVHVCSLRALGEGRNQTKIRTAQRVARHHYQRTRVRVHEKQKTCYMKILFFFTFRWSLLSMSCQLESDVAIT